MANEFVIPLLPCLSINETLTFYQALGFEVTYQQTKPNLYACVKRGGIDLHFFVLKGLDPAQSYSSCYIGTTDVEGLYQAFAAGLKKYYGKKLVAGIPRLTPLRNMYYGERRFNVIDPAGNWIRIGQTLEQPASDPALAFSNTSGTKLEQALEMAILLYETKGQCVPAAKVLDKAFALNEPVSNALKVQALVMRAGLAITLQDYEQAKTLLIEVRQIPLDETERTTLTAELQRADDLEQMLL
jgi:catechol 2,3-dioxygenase-like lactoylglutathione lyase family enzyme